VGSEGGTTTVDLQQAAAGQIEVRRTYDDVTVLLFAAALPAKADVDKCIGRNLREAAHREADLAAARLPVLLLTGKLGHDAGAAGAGRPLHGVAAGAVGCCALRYRSGGVLRARAVRKRQSDRECRCAPRRSGKPCLVPTHVTPRNLPLSPYYCRLQMLQCRACPIGRVMWRPADVARSRHGETYGIGISPTSLGTL
jgi:hypothetical protein